MSDEPKSAEVYVMPGVERRDLIVPLASEQLFQKAIEQGVMDATIVGRHRDGSLYIATAMSDADRATGMMMRAVNWLTSGEIEADQHGEDEGA